MMRLKYSPQILLVSSLLTLASSAALASEELQVYGKFNITAHHTDDESEAESKFEVKSHASRFGVKGKSELDDGLSAFYQMEWQIDVSDNTNSSDDHIKARNQFIGIKGGFGSILLGRRDTPLKRAQKKIDLFNDLMGDIKNVLQGEVRAKNVIEYTTAKHDSGISFSAMVIPGEDGTEDGDNGLADAVSSSVSYSSGNLYLAIAHDKDVSDIDSSTRVVAQYKIDNWQLGALYQNTDLGDNSENGFVGSAAYKFGADGKYKLKLQYAASDMKAEGRKQTSIGIDRSLSKKMTVYGFYTSQTEDAADKDKSYLGVGMVYKF